MTENYKIVLWPDSQLLMDDDEFFSCLLIDDIPTHKSVGSAAYAVPEHIYNRVYGK